jgi:hypothetical protein
MGQTGAIFYFFLLRSHSPNLAPYVDDPVITQPLSRDAIDDSGRRTSISA